VHDSKIGFGTVILARKVDLNGCTIGRFNRFIGPMDLSIAPGADIETHNVFDCGEWTADAKHFDRYERCLVIESNARITDHHLFDVAGRFVLGRGSWIAGRGSQFWTHGIDVIDRNISIGRNCYIGSAVRFAPGSGVADNVVVGLGSVVTSRIEASDVLIAGSPARVVSTGRRWRCAPDDARRLMGSQPEM
jgi:acetyltransferase-like isoleucine patch superfamily enzyme